MSHTPHAAKGPMALARIWKVSDFLGKPRYSLVSDQGLVKKLHLNLFESLASIL